MPKTKDDLQVTSPCIGFSIIATFLVVFFGCWAALEAYHANHSTPSPTPSPGLPASVTATLQVTGISEADLVADTTKQTKIISGFAAAAKLVSTDVKITKIGTTQITRRLQAAPLDVEFEIKAKSSAAASAVVKAIKETKPTDIVQAIQKAGVPGLTVVVGRVEVKTGAPTPAPTPEKQVDLLVSSPLGKYAGLYTGSGSVAYLGIKYASVPQRFAPSIENKQMHTGVYNATAKQDKCVQASDMGGAISGVEDCLFLNIWRPANIPTKPLLPVMLWIHGGSFLTGSGNEPLFDGANITAKQDVIVITINYRLGPLGFLVTDNTGKGGLNGILDMVNALKFTRTMIASFGGDADKVTIFGESAGGESTCLLSVLPAAKGLFRASITQSGPCVGPWGVQSASKGVNDASALMAQVGVDNVGALKTVAVTKIAKWADGTSTVGFYADSSLLSKPVGDYFTGSRSDLNVQAMMIGSTSYDGTSWLLPYAPLSNGQYTSATDKLWNMPHEIDAAKASTGKICAVPVAAKVRELYPITNQALTSPLQSRAAFVQQNSDYAVLCPTLGIAGAASDATKIGGAILVYTYQFDVFHPKCDGSWLFSTATGLSTAAPPTEAANPKWASHGAEIPWVFDNPSLYLLPTGPFCPFVTTEKSNLQDAIMTRWVNFATTLDPNKGAKGTIAGTTTMPKWEKHLAATNALTMVFSLPESQVVSSTNFASGAQKPQCDFFNGGSQPGFSCRTTAG